MNDSASVPSPTLSSMSVEELTCWLKEAGIPEKFCDTFTENYVDGESFLSLSELDLKEMIPPIGIVKKLLRLQQGASHSGPTISSQKQVERPSSGSLPQSIASIPGSGSSNSSPSRVEIPDFWRPEVEECIQNQCLDDTARCEIVRTLVCLLFSRYGKVDRTHCGVLARQLILKYPFMKDDGGNGYQSWEDKMVERIRNAIKHDRKRNPASSFAASVKRSKTCADDKKKDGMLRRYPSGVEGLEDSSSLDSHVSAIAAELGKTKPRDSILLPLMRSSYQTRRLFVLHEAQDVRSILDEWPALKRQALVEQEFQLITGDEECKPKFLSKWNAYYLAVLRYAKTSGKKAITSVLDHTDETNAVTNQLCALKVLSLAVGARGQNALPFVYKEYNSDVVTVSKAVADSEVSNIPRVAAMVADDQVQYFIFVEKTVLFEVSSLPLALFLMFSCYYTYHVEYPPKALGLLYFFQDYILGHPDSLKRPSTYLAVMSDLSNHL